MEYRWARWAVSALAVWLVISATSGATTSTSGPTGLAAQHNNHFHAHARWRSRKPDIRFVKKAQQTRDHQLADVAAETPAPLGSTPAEQVFDLSRLGEAELEWARHVLNVECTFDWSRLAAAVGSPGVAIELGDPPARGMYYPPEKRLVVHRYFYSKERTVASRVLAWETAHVVDIYGLSEEHRAAITDLYHQDVDHHGWFAGDYDDQVGEAFMEGFVAAYCPGLNTAPTFSHATTPEIATGIRSLLG